MEVIQDRPAHLDCSELMRLSEALPKPSKLVEVCLTMMTTLRVLLKANLRRPKRTKRHLRLRKEDYLTIWMTLTVTTFKRKTHPQLQVRPLQKNQTCLTLMNRMEILLCLLQNQVWCKRISQLPPIKSLHYLIRKIVMSP